jgi:calcium binding protein 39
MNGSGHESAVLGPPFRPTDDPESNSKQSWTAPRHPLTDPRNRRHADALLHCHAVTLSHRCTDNLTNHRPLTTDLATRAHAAFLKLPYESSQERTVEEISRLFAGMKELMYGDDANNKAAALAIVREACKTELVEDMVESIGMLGFETRKDVASVFGSIMRMDVFEKGPGGEEVRIRPGHDYLMGHLDLLMELFNGFSLVDIAFNCQDMFRECIRHEDVAKYVLESPEMFPYLFEKLHGNEFELASDSFATFKDLLTRHKAMVSAYLIGNYDWFFLEYSKLLESPNYFTRRQSVKLLGELLLERANVRVLVKYVADAENLKVMMNLLKSAAKSIQWEAFHVFKVFVANPNKSPAVVEILLSNKEKLLQYFEEFQPERTDQQFLEEKAVIIQEIALLGQGNEEGAA